MGKFMSVELTLFFSKLMSAQAALQPVSRSAGMLQPLDCLASIPYW